MMQKPVLEKPSAILGELENSCLLCQWLRGVNAPGSEPQQRGYRIFIHGQAWLSWFAGLWGLGDCKEQDKAEWDKLQFLVLWVPTFWDWGDPDFARSKLSYRGRRSRKSYKILTFPLLPLSWCFYHSLQKASSHVSVGHSELPSLRGLYWAITICNFMDSIREVMNWVIALRIQGPNKSTTDSMKRGPVKARRQDAPLQTLFQLPQESASFSLLFMICSLSCWAMFQTISDWFT